MIDGRDAEVAIGTVYKITLQWGPNPRLFWEALGKEGRDVRAPLWCKSCAHTFTIRGSFNGWMDQWMTQVLEVGRLGSLEAHIRLGLSGSEEFVFTRDCSDDQIF